MFLLTLSKSGIGTFLNTNTGASFRCKTDRSKNFDGSEIISITSIEAKKEEPKQPAPQLPSPQPAVVRGKHQTRRTYAGRTVISDDIRSRVLLFKNKEKLTWKGIAELIGLPEHVLHCVAYTTNYQMQNEFYEKLASALNTLSGEN